MLLILLKWSDGPVGPANGGMDYKTGGHWFDSQPGLYE